MAAGFVAVMGTRGKSSTVKDASFGSIAVDIVHMHWHSINRLSAQRTFLVNYAARKPKASADDDGSVVCLRGNQLKLYD